MRFVWAVAAFVVAAVLIGAGIAQRTVFHGPSTQSAEIALTDDSPYTVIDGAVLNALPGTQTLKVEGDDGVFVAYGRTADVSAWLADQKYTAVAAGEENSIVSTVVEPEPTPSSTTTPDAATPDAATETDAAAETDAATDGSAPETTPTRSPVGSDLWLAEYSDPAAVVAPLQLPPTMSVLVASDGTNAAPASISITWDVSQSTPWSGPLILLGIIVLVGGVVLYVLAIRHARRSRGPRRKAPPPLLETQPIDVSIEAAEKGVITAGPTTRRSGRRKAVIAVPALVGAALLFTGCSADAWPQLAPTPTPSATAPIVDSDEQQAPAVTEGQARQILARISETVAQADEARDATLAGTRLTGAALAERATNYTLRGSIADYTALPAIPSEPTQIILPQAYDGWPRTVMAVVQNNASDATTSTIMMMTQADAWSEYKLSYLGNLGGSTEMPDLAPAYIGAAQVPPGSSFLLVAPDQLASAYADVLSNGDQSSFAGLFDEQSDLFSESVAADRQKRLDAFNTTATNTGTLEFSSAAGANAPLALATLESGAIVAVTVTETDTVKPANEDVVIKFEGNPTVQALTGVAESKSGVSTTFADQLFFYVPAQSSTEKVRLLGYSSNILEAKVL
ncbi:glycosyl transferase [Microbacterium sp. cx-59]|uniref:glycosyl transferase n=1 Tax=Microbacterium sp. cx-59 TaxID=2891207 RepID=UPI001E380916|nr:glycosyl transferase [Microbacterium sp. cx-59]MCC4907143.1 glycosyl transferase [Microbacterium sp. cx-59]